MLNEKFAKKVGEVLAFERAGVEFFERGQKTLLPIMTQAGVESSIKRAKSMTADIERLAHAHGIAEIALAKADATGAKLSSMRDSYVQDRWDDGAELMEWLGFFEGAAIVHWSLVRGAAQAFSLSEFEQLGSQAMDDHTQLLGKVSDAIARLFKEDNEA